jgi:plastocyanin
MTRTTLAALAALALVPALAHAQKGVITGSALWTGKEVPKNSPADVDKDKDHCLSKGAILKNEIIVDPKTKGIANVMVWVVDADPKNINKPLPLTEGAKAWLAKNKEVVIDQPCCVFIPRVTPLVVGQTLTVKNSSPISHNINIMGGAAGPSINPIMPAGSKYTYDKKVDPRIFPIPYSCNVHAWMKGYLFAIPSPYFAVTGADGSFKIENLPSGKFRLMAWHEKGGFLLLGPGGVKDRGVLIEVKGDGMITAPKIEMSSID